MVYFKSTKPGWNNASLLSYLYGKGISIGQVGEYIRAVTHLDVSTNDIAKTVSEVRNSFSQNQFETNSNIQGYWSLRIDQRLWIPRDICRPTKPIVRYRYLLSGVWSARSSKKLLMKFTKFRGDQGNVQKSHFVKFFLIFFGFRSICRQGVPILDLLATIDVNLTPLVKESHS